MEGLFENQGYQSVFNQKSVRKNFTRKVFSIVGIQLFFTFMVVALFRSSQTLAKVSDSLQILAVIGSLVSCLILSCHRQTARSYPKNYVILGIFTFCEAILVENILAYYDSDIIFQAGFMTALLMGVLGAFSQFTEIDFTAGKQMGILLAVHLACVIFGFMFFSVHSVLYSIVFLLIFCAYVVIDLQMIMGNKNRSLQIDDYILASMILYTDIIQIFLKLVDLLSNKEDSRRSKKRGSN